MLLLRNLLPAYQAIETGLAGRHQMPAFDIIATPALNRSAGIHSDLRQLQGEDWSKDLPLLPSALLYAERVADAAQGDGSRLIAHAYVRYMGDLSGGQIMKRLFARSLQLPPEALSFYEFPGIDDINWFKSEYREALDRAAAHIVDAGTLLEEAAEAFRLNIAVSREVAAQTTA